MIIENYNNIQNELIINNKLNKDTDTENNENIDNNKEQEKDKEKDKDKDNNNNIIEHFSETTTTAAEEVPCKTTGNDNSWSMFFLIGSFGIIGHILASFLYLGGSLGNPYYLLFLVPPFTFYTGWVMSYGEYIDENMGNCNPVFDDYVWFFPIVSFFTGLILYIFCYPSKSKFIRKSQGCIIKSKYRTLIKTWIYLLLFIAVRMEKNRKLCPEYKVTSSSPTTTPPSTEEFTNIKPNKINKSDLSPKQLNTKVKPDIATIEAFGSTKEESISRNSYSYNVFLHSLNDAAIALIGLYSLETVLKLMEKVVSIFGKFPGLPGKAIQLCFLPLDIFLKILKYLVSIPGLKDGVMLTMVHIGLNMRNNTKSLNQNTCTEYDPSGTFKLLGIVVIVNFILILALNFDKTKEKIIRNVNKAKRFASRKKNRKKLKKKEELEETNNKNILRNFVRKKKKNKIKKKKIYI